MSKPTQALPVKPVFSVFAPAAAILNDTINRLSALYGQHDFISEQMPFDYTDYYCREMGQALVRRFLSMKEKGMCRVIRSYEKCSPERGKQIGGLLHLPILKRQLYMFSLFDIGTNSRCHLHHIDSLTFF
jgi:hypothetical protein